jgi:sugar lactone lactonase YvrE
MSSRLPVSAVLVLVAILVGCQGDARAGAADAPIELRPTDELENPFATMIRPWGRLPDGREWGQVSALDIDGDGVHLWVADRCGSSSCVGSELPVVMRLDPDGTVLTAFGEGLFIRPHGVHVDRENNVWVTDHLNARPAQLEEFPDAEGKGQQVFKFSPRGEILLALGTAGEPGDPPTHLNNPTAVIVATNGDIFIAEGHSNQNPPGRISKFSSDGTYIGSWGEFGEGPGQFRTPHGLAFDSQGRLFVADRGNNRIQVFDQDGTFLEELRQFGRPNDVFIDRSDVLYAIDSESSEETNPGFSRGIYIGDARTGERTGFIPPHPTDSGIGTHGEGVALDREGNLYVAEVSIRGLTKYTNR